MHVTALAFHLAGVRVVFTTGSLPLAALAVIVGMICAPAAGLPIWGGALLGLGTMASLIAHELGHAAAARRLGLPIGELRVFLLGAGLHLGAAPPTALGAAILSGAGPATNLLLAVLFAALINVSPIAALATGLVVVNLALAALNLVPLYPADGGKLVAAALRGLGISTRGAVIAAQLLTVPLAAGLAIGGLSLLWHSSPTGALLFASQWVFLGVSAAQSLLTAAKV